MFESDLVSCALRMGVYYYLLDSDILVVLRVKHRDR